MKLTNTIGTITGIAGVGSAVTGTVLLASNPLGLGFLLGGLAAVGIAWYVLGVDTAE